MDLEKHAKEGPGAPSPDLTEKAPAGLRASDADRDRTAEILAAALAEGRLTADEHAERLEGVYQAKTVAELEPYVADLPAAHLAHSAHADHSARPAAPVGHQPAPGAVPLAPDENLVAVFSSSTRKGRWRVGRRTHAYAVFGNVEIDLTEAIFEYQQVVIKAVSVFGNVEVRVPENVSLRGSGSGIFGNFEVEALDSGETGAPVVFVDGYAVLGSIEAKPKRGKLIHDLHKYVGHTVARHMRKHLG
ncbi:DUF1707 SHOCT-like domain-containing protein [Streptomyces sp. KLOTTS4A1]|uniref:DUF1707 SHOCT-like domain-containing protein n=1 Tax=Streptomyces sp. KLOTTS4A1 TaxID=3390996 RepID=UPI0039F5C7B5